MEYRGTSETEIQLSYPIHADPEARWASWQAGVLSPNDVRGEEGMAGLDRPDRRLD
jgi:hypothetical protein